MLSFTNLEKIVREGRADEADVAKCSDYDVCYADNEESEAQVSGIVLGLLCVAKNRHSKRVQVESMRKDARKRCKIVREEYDGAHSADILPLSGLVLRCCANLIVSVDPRVGGEHNDRNDEDCYEDGAKAAKSHKASKVALRGDAYQDEVENDGSVGRAEMIKLGVLVGDWFLIAEPDIYTK